MENVENIDSVVDSVNVVTRTSPKTNKEYQLLQVKLANGYDIEQFVDKAVMYMISDLAKKESSK